MAKKSKAAKGNESGGSRLVTALIALVIILIWLAVFGFLIKLDVGGIGSNMLYPVLKDVPVVNKILPEPSEAMQAEEDNYQYNTLRSANERIKALESQLESQGGTANANSDYIAQLEAEIKNLQKYKKEQDDFDKRVAEFDEKVVFNDNAPDISEYEKYYASIQPENAERIYNQVVQELQNQQQAKKIATLYSNAEPAKAATVLSEMTHDLDLVCAILDNMSEKQAAAIIQELDSGFAAQITKKMSMAG
ncbi:MAG TPA: hypothetical protein DCZ23_04900 [Lachnospiraceae bacterium]|nr:hypothetical protein [Lachnospiraceae bacterium]